MKSKFFSVFVVALALVFSVSLASDKDGKSTKKAEQKKEVKGCCMPGKEVKNEKDCSDKALMDCDPAEAKTGKASAKPAEPKPDTKKDGEGK